MGELLKQEIKKLLKREGKLKDQFLLTKMEKRHLKMIKERGSYSYRSYNPNINKTETITINESFWDKPFEEQLRSTARHNVIMKIRKNKTGQGWSEVRKALEMEGVY